MILTIPSLSSREERKIRGHFLFVALTAAAGALGGCAAPAPEGIDDPYEVENRSTHAFNLALDSKILRPAATATHAGNGPLGRGIANFADNLDAPGDVVNSLLQFRIGKATENTLRFAINTVIGVGGIFDPATAMGVPGKKTDFGETLHVWGVGEGSYLEVPFVGPSTQRDALGDVVDFVIDPLNYILPAPESYFGTAAKLAAKVGDRGRYSATVDSILYESADSYAQARLLYLQNRRYELGQTADEGSFVDPYEDPYGQ